MADYPYSNYQPQGIPYATQIAKTKRAPMDQPRYQTLLAEVQRARTGLPQIDAILESLRTKTIATPEGTRRPITPEEEANYWKLVAPYPMYEPALESTRLGTEEQAPNIIQAAQAQVGAQEKPFEQFRGETQAIIPDIQKKYSDLYAEIQKSEQAGLANIQAASTKREQDIKGQMAARGIVGSSFEDTAQTQRISDIGRLEADLRARMGTTRAQYGTEEVDKVSALQRLIAQSRIDQARVTFDQFSQAQGNEFQRWLSRENLDINLKQLSLQEFNTAFNNALKKMELESQLMGLGQNPLYNLSY